MCEEVVLIGDIHGDISNYLQMIKSFNKSIQLGDMGIGFGYKYNKFDHEFPYHKNKHSFIAGNHDNPEVCKKHKNYLGNFGITDDGIFFVGGGYSIDKEFRTIGKDWWEDEELSINEFNDVLEVYESIKPDFVISHSQPSELIDVIFKNRIECRTQQYFSEMFRIHQPKKWISAHLHLNFKTQIENTEFIVVDSLNYYRLEI